MAPETANHTLGDCEYVVAVASRVKTAMGRHSIPFPMTVTSPSESGWRRSSTTCSLMKNRPGRPPAYLDDLERGVFNHLRSSPKQLHGRIVDEARSWRLAGIQVVIIIFEKPMVEYIFQEQWVLSEHYD